MLRRALQLDPQNYIGPLSPEQSLRQAGRAREAQKSLEESRQLRGETNS
jgi:hypothetical protein